MSYPVIPSWSDLVAEEDESITSYDLHNEITKPNRSKGTYSSPLSKYCDPFLHMEDEDDLYDSYTFGFSESFGSSQVERATNVLDSAFNDAFPSAKPSIEQWDPVEELADYLRPKSRSTEAIDEQIYSIEHEIARIAEERRQLKLSLGSTPVTSPIDSPSELQDSPIIDIYMDSLTNSPSFSHSSGSEDLDLSPQLEVFSSKPEPIITHTSTTMTTPTTTFKKAKTRENTKPSTSKPKPETKRKVNLLESDHPIIIKADTGKREQKKKTTRRKAEVFQQPELAFNYIDTNTSKKLKMTIEGDTFKREQIVRVKAPPRNEDEEIDDKQKVLMFVAMAMQHNRQIEQNKHHRASSTRATETWTLSLTGTPVTRRWARSFNRMMGYSPSMARKTQLPPTQRDADKLSKSSMLVPPFYL
ncbi:hypothetical protein PROFUN_15038 [Planoprotostelium fungivorum]|uniref:Uncharacterized protein n=1 Tax=Planoprotostelium fungivorum TaxID=1890364 RepID=A0A2P6MZM7_9EUKA|nr:hypothetical protein PROFUN_15038 [Planoprotostelium fungivorum]